MKFENVNYGELYYLFLTLKNIKNAKLLKCNITDVSIMRSK